MIFSSRNRRSFNKTLRAQENHLSEQVLHHVGETRVADSQGLRGRSGVYAVRFLLAVLPLSLRHRGTRLLSLSLFLCLVDRLCRSVSLS